MNFTATIRDPFPPPSSPPHTHPPPPPPPLPSRSSSASSKKSPAVCGQGRSRTLCRRSGCSGTRWSTGSRRAPSCRSSMLGCRRGETSRWRRSGTSLCRFPSRLSKCPRSHLHPVVLAGAGFPSAADGGTVWWKCLRSYPFLLCTGLWSRNVDIPVPHGRGGQGGGVSAQDRIQLRLVE